LRFWDSSGVISLVLREEATPVLESLLRRDREVAIWWATPVECASAQARAARGGHLPARRAQAAQHIFAALWRGAFVVEPSTELRERAARLVHVHPLRAADALQLAAALDWCAERPSGESLVCLDQRLRRAAWAEGFEVLPPAEEIHEASEVEY